MKEKEVTKEMLFEQLNSYLNKESIACIQKAYDFAYQAHIDQKRKSGEPYFVHLLNVAYSLSLLHCGPATVCAGLLHDTIEDTSVTKEDLIKEFSEEVATLVEAVTKIGNISFSDEKEYQAENHRKIFIAMAKDVRVIIIKLMDRLHNMRTLSYLSSEKQQKIASETLQVYAPIAHRLGFGEVKSEMEDLCFYYLDSVHYKEIAELVALKKEERDEKIKQKIAELTILLSNQNIKFRIFGRSKHLYSIYHKMITKNKSFDEIYDLQAIRIITETDLNCYEILGHIHAQYNPMPGRFKDYIAMPKSNMYQSLHTTIIEDGDIYEIQIRTEEMDSIAEKGVAAHWGYKEGTNYSSVSEQREIENKLGWYHDLINLTEDNYDASDLIESIQKDIFEANIYVLTPKGRVIELPNGSTPIDFAYKIHTELGHAMIGATVNGSIAPLNRVLQTGDVVSIKTSKQQIEPSEEWINIAKTSLAKKKIRSFFLKKEAEERKEDIIKGEKILKEELTRHGFEPNDYLDKTHLENVYNSINGLGNYDELMYAISKKSANLNQIISKITNKTLTGNDNETLTKLYSVQRSHILPKANVYVEGIENMKISIAQCCLPVKGDKIVGYVSQGQGIKVHRDDCPNIIHEKRLIDVYWGDDEVSEYETWLSIDALDRAFLISDVVTVISTYRASLLAINSEVLPDMIHASIQIKVKVKDLDQLTLLMSNMKKLNGINEVNRIIK